MGGSNLELSEADVYAAEDVISKAAVMVCQLEIPQQVSLLALKLAKKHGGKYANTEVRI